MLADYEDLEREDVLAALAYAARLALLVSTGNISNDKLEMIVRGHILEIVQAFESASFIELGRDSLTVHEYVKNGLLREPFAL